MAQNKLYLSCGCTEEETGSRMLIMVRLCPQHWEELLAAKPHLTDWLQKDQKGASIASARTRTLFSREWIEEAVTLP